MDHQKGPNERPEQHDEAYAAEGNGYLARQLEALDKSPKVRRRLTLLDVRCRACGERAFSVVMTEPFWVVRTFDNAPRDRALAPQELQDADARREWYLEHGKFDSFTGRREAAKFLPITSERRRDSALLTSMCKCRRHDVSEAWLWERIDQARRGGRRVVTIG